MEEPASSSCYSRPMAKPEPRRDRKVVPIAEATEQRRRKLARRARAGALDLVPNGPDAASNFAMLGNLALVEGEFEDAIEPYSRALALSPDQVNARSGRGRAYAALGRHALALADFDRAAKLEPNEPRHHRGRATALAHLGRMEEAVRAASCALEIAPGDAGAHYLRAVYRSQIDPDDPGVRADLDRAVELEPDAVPYLRARAVRLMDEEDHERALVDIDRALATEPDDASLLYERAECLTGFYGQKGLGFDDKEARLGASLVTLERALERAPTGGELRGDILYGMVRAREGMRDEDAYLAMLDRAIDAMPDETPLISVREDRRRRRGDLEGAASDRKRLEALGVRDDRADRS
jgi:tetratricopeptide (TPR) repeat protein